MKRGFYTIMFNVLAGPSALENLHVMNMQMDEAA